MKGMIGGVAMLMACWLNSAGADEADSGPAITDSRPVVEVALMDFPGYSEFDASGQIAGKTVQLITRLLEQAGYPFRMRIMPAARIWRGLEDGSVDLWPGTVTRPGWEFFTLQTDRQLGLVSIHLYHRPGEPAPVWPEGLRGKKLILMMNHIYTQDVLGTVEDPALGVELHRGSSHAGAVNMLLRGRGDYLLHYRTQVEPVVVEMGMEPLPSQRIIQVPMRFVVSQRSGFAEQLKADLDRAYDELAMQGVELNVTRQ
ncbi:substrate-binding periplasmic protein [Pseudomonas saliphila]|uniref:substrate-binding periplasmic protein n=1 Tax=Pseudomonas saliphila TaxID=2586906 RepID=UPI00123C7A34|nr:bifunctional lytic transglycosylase/amino acid ABC transporter substrate-binding protein [Pseudomonas saliphila]